MEALNARYLKPYVPDIIVESLLSPGKLESGIEGSLLFADLSGFTSMSEKLARLGRRGGEKLAEIINNCFNPLLELVLARNGDVIKFGGDALLILFRGENKTARAFDCAVELFDWISNNSRIDTPAGEFNLGIHAGISDGRIFNLIVGESRRDLLFCGDTVEKAYSAADIANLGQIVVTSRTAGNLPGIKFNKIDSDYFLYQYKDEPIRNYFSGHCRVKAIDPHPDLQLEQFIDKELKERLYYNKGRIEGEHRIITSLFIGVNSLRKNLENDPGTALSSIQNYFVNINDIITKNGGYIARIDSSPGSEKILVFFGAPRCHGNDAQNCLRAILEIESALKNLNRDFNSPVTHRYGVNSGLCFVGDVGGKIRREYTAMGDAINLAARLMSNAEYGNALVGEETSKTCLRTHIFKDSGEIEVKGKEKPVRTFLLVGEQVERQSDTVMIGRDQELSRIKEYIEDIKNENPRLLVILGEPGAGKSLLCGKLRILAAENGIDHFEGNCFKLPEKTAYGPIKAIISALLGLGKKSSQKEKRLSLQRILKELDELEWEPLIAPLLDYFPAAPPHLKNLPEETKKSKIGNILCRIICEAGERDNTIIIIEDIQWIDSASYDIVRLLTESPDRPGLLFIGRPGNILDELNELVRPEKIELGALTPENSEKLFLSVLGGAKPGEEILQNVVEKSGGNPFYLEEMAKAYDELGEARFDRADTVPSGIESVITARIDNLSEMVKKTVRTASVIGRVFGYQVLKEIFPDRARTGKLRDYLNELAGLDLTPVERIQPVLEYIFKHILTQEVAYNGLSFSARKSLHTKAAEYFASRKRLVKRNPETVAGHFLLAEEHAKALPYLVLSGSKAASEFANKEAFEYFGKALETAIKVKDKKYLIESIRNRGLLARDTAQYKLAENDFIKLGKLSVDDRKLQADSERELSFIYRMTGEYDKASESLNRLENILPDDIPNRVFCLNGHAEVARRGGKLPECRQLLLEALSLMENNDIDQGLSATVNNNLGICHWSLGRLKDAEDYYKTALRLYRKLKDLGGQSKIINNLGIISEELGKLQLAASSYEKAEKIFKRIGASRSEAYACANLGTNLLSRGYLQKATAKLFRAREIFDNIGDRHSSAYTLGDLGYIRFREGDIETAKQLIGEAINRGSELKDNELILESGIRMSKLDIYSGIKEINDIERLISMAREAGSSELEIKARAAKSSALLITGDMATLKAQINCTEKIEEFKNYPELRLELSVIKLIIEYIGGDNREALKILKKSLSECFSRDLALIISDLRAAGVACNIMSDIPEKTMMKIGQYITRPTLEMDQNETEKYRGFQKRLDEFYKTAVSVANNRAAKSVPTAESQV
jgi:class 3 adenylate cyclase/tetratricopeptide (TPR) repeat protein